MQVSVDDDGTVTITGVNHLDFRFMLTAASLYRTDSIHRIKSNLERLEAKALCKEINAERRKDCMMTAHRVRQDLDWAMKHKLFIDRLDELLTDGMGSYNEFLINQTPEDENCEN